MNTKSTYYTHGMHPYPAKFSPKMITEHLISNTNELDIVLDPFCGSGTTLVEAVINNRYAYGIDLNPIACLMSVAKTNIYSEADILEIDYHILKVAEIKVLECNIDTFEFPNRSHWFQDNVAKELTILKQYIMHIENNKIKDLLICAFSKNIVKVSNQDSEVRYTAKQKNIQNNYVFNLFINTLNEYKKSIQEIPSQTFKTKATIYNNDILNTLNNFETDAIDFVITSPPYINTFDYYLYHKQRMFWLDYDHKIVRKLEIGNHHRIDTKTFQQAKNEYIESMQMIFLEINRVLKTDKKFVIIIGDGIVNGILIDMSNVISEITKNTLFTIEKIESTNLSETTKSFNRKFSNLPKKEHFITLKNNK